MYKFAALLALALLPACEAQIQDTSGADYLAARNNVQTDPEIAAAAAIEPDLRLPARIGIVRMVYGRISTAPAAEADDWQDLITRAQSFGTFVPITTINAAASGAGTRPSQTELRTIAATQHLDYLIIADYDVSRGTATAGFIDVRNGYVYGTATATTPSGGQNGFWGGQISNPGRLDRATARLTAALLPELEDMLTQLAATTR